MIKEGITIDKVNEAAKFINTQIQEPPTIGVILGSGFGSFSKSLQDAVVIPYGKVPHFGDTSVEGHSGVLVYGSLHKQRLLVMSGRFHCYEGYTMAEAAFPVAVMKKLGIETLIVTNAAGGINPEYGVGDLVLIADHIKLVMDSPLRGLHVPELGARFNDMTYAYTRHLRDITKEVAYGMGIQLREGVYAYMPGPQYETPAEIRALRALGADCVGMSTVAEVIAAANFGMKVLGVSLVTNAAAGILDKPLSHDEVMQAANESVMQFGKLINAIISRI